MGIIDFCFSPLFSLTFPFSLSVRHIAVRGMMLIVVRPGWGLGCVGLTNAFERIGTDLPGYTFFR